QPVRTCTPSPSASAVSTRLARPGRTTAASSPGPMWTPPPTSIASRCTSRATHACSPTSRRRRTVRLPEHRLDLLEEALGERVHVLAGDAGELLEHLTLPRREFARRLDDNADDLVAAPVPIQVRDPAPLQADHVSGL